MKKRLSVLVIALSGIIGGALGAFSPTPVAASGGECAYSCSSGSSCQQECTMEGFTITCGMYGVCDQAPPLPDCASACGYGAPCERRCQDGIFQISCANSQHGCGT